jgi:predicted small metal-binding protein
VAYEFDCRTAGATGCNFKARGATEDEVIAKVSEHVQKKHKVKNVTDTIGNYARSAIRQS